MARLEAADSLALLCRAGEPWRVEWLEPDWLGPLGLLAHRAGVRYGGLIRLGGDVRQLGEPARTDLGGSDALGPYSGLRLHWTDLPLPLALSAKAYADRPVIVFRIEATANLPEEIASGAFRDVSVAWPMMAPAQRHPGGGPQDARTFGHQCAEFALPVFGDDRTIGFLFAPHRPQVVQPLMFIAADGRTLLIAPLDHFHEQVIAVPRDADDVDHGVRCGWHGDLVEIQRNFATEMALWAAPSPRAALDQWCAFLRERHGTLRPSRYADVGVGQLSYWTDNGAVYYYRTEPGLDYTQTLERAVTRLRDQDVPIRSVQIDSWFYPHEHLRPVSPEGAPIVPPSGAMTWEPRADVFPQGLHGLKQKIGGLPLSFHSRHFSAKSPYFKDFLCWRDGEYAHPREQGFFDMLMAEAASWGAITYEQDWLVESFLGVRGLREAPGRARRWLEQMNRAAREHGLTLQFCMATPAQFLQTTTLSQVTSIRTSGDYRYMFDNGLNWVWFLHGNALARALGLNPFKDVFLSHGPTSLSDGEPYAEVEALLAALSTGPIAIGDQIDATDRDLVMRTCRNDGVLIKPDVPLAAIDPCYRTNAFLQKQPLIGECYSDHPAGRWAYVTAFHASQVKEPHAFRVDLDSLGDSQPSVPVMLYDWRRRSFERLDPDGGWACELGFQDWDYRVLCPVLSGEVTVFGDVSKYVTVGDKHVADITCSEGMLELTVLDRPGTVVDVHGYSASAPRGVKASVGALVRRIERSDAEESWSWNASGHWMIRARVGEHGYTRVSMEIG